MSVMCWNVAGYTGEYKDLQLAEVKEINPDVLALQEIRKGSVEFWTQSLADLGYEVVTSDLNLLDAEGPFLPHKGVRFGKRVNFNLIASRCEIAKLDGLHLADPGEGFPEKHLVARVDANGTPVEIHNIHTPPGSTTKMLKVEFWEAMLKRVNQPTDAARILCGDFNSSWDESEDTFVLGGGRRDPEEEARWVAAERGFLEHPELRDVYRARRQAGEPFAVSHRRGRGQARTDCRYDHIFISEEFDIELSACGYLTRILDDELSDHAPVVAELAFR